MEGSTMAQDEGVAAAASCAGCGIETPTGMVRWLAPAKAGQPRRPVCPRCVAALEAVLALEIREPNVRGALIVGGIAALIGSLLWFGLVVATKHELGLLAAMLGAFIGGGVVLGSGQKR